MLFKRHFFKKEKASRNREKMSAKYISDIGLTFRI